MLIELLTASVGHLDAGRNSRSRVENPAKVKRPPDAGPRVLAQGVAEILIALEYLAVVRALDLEIEPRIPRQHQIREGQEQVSRERVDVLVWKLAEVIAVRREPSGVEDLVRGRSRNRQAEDCSQDR